MNTVVDPAGSGDDLRQQIYVGNLMILTRSDAQRLRRLHPRGAHRVVPAA